MALSCRFVPTHRIPATRLTWQRRHTRLGHTPPSQHVRDIIREEVRLALEDDKLTTKVEKKVKSIYHETSSAVSQTIEKNPTIRNVWHKWYRSIVTGVLVTIGVIITVIIFRARLARETANVAGAALKNEKLIAEVGRTVEALVSNITKNEQSREDLLVLLEVLLTDPSTKNHLVKLLTDLVEDPETVSHLQHLLRKLLKDESTTKALLELLYDLLDDKTLQRKGGRAVRGILVNAAWSSNPPTTLPPTPKGTENQEKKE